MRIFCKRKISFLQDFFLWKKVNALLVTSNSRKLLIYTTLELYLRCLRRLIFTR
jgi:hypothetical protein